MEKRFLILLLPIIFLGNGCELTRKSETLDSQVVTTQEQKNLKASEEIKDYSYYSKIGSESLCSKGSEIANKNFNKFYNSTLLWSHYVKTESSCYFETNYQLAVGNNLVNYYGLHVIGGPSEFDVDNSMINTTKVAYCSIPPNQEAQCRYNGQKQSYSKNDDGIINNYWIVQFSFDRAPSISLTDYITLKNKAKNAE